MHSVGLGLLIRSPKLLLIEVGYFYYSDESHEPSKQTTAMSCQELVELASIAASPSAIKILTALISIVSPLPSTPLPSSNSKLSSSIESPMSNCGDTPGNAGRCRRRSRMWTCAPAQFPCSNASRSNLYSARTTRPASARSRPVSSSCVNWSTEE